MDLDELRKIHFSRSRTFVSSSLLFQASLSPTQWLCLQALDLQASSGPCSSPPPPPNDLDQRMLWRQWRQLGSLSIEEAQVAFVRLVLQACEAIEDELDVIKFLDELRDIRTQSDEKLVEGHTSKSVGKWRGKGVMAYEEDGGKGRWAMALDLKSGISKLREDTEILSETAFDDSRHMAMAVQADVTIEERTMEARHQRSQVEELKNEVHLLIRQLDTDIDAALSRRKWSYEQIESQCEELLARCETTTNTYKNQLALTPSTRSRLTSVSALLFIPITAAASYWYWNKKFGRK